MSTPPDASAPSITPPTPPGDDPKSLWATLLEALAGSEQDFTEGPIGRAVLLLAVPMVLEMVMESLFAVVDVFWVARLGPDAVAAVGLTEGVVSLIYALGMGLSVAAGALVARRIGEKQPERAAGAAGQALILAVLASVVIAVVGVAAAPWMLRVLGATPRVVATGSAYTAVMFGGNATILLLFLINSVFRSAGDAAIAMRVLWLANGINIALGPCLIFGLGPFPAMGVTGAAVATTIGRAIGVAYQLVVLTRRGRRITVERRHLALDRTVMLNLLQLSGSATLQSVVGMMSWLGLVRIVAMFGSAALAGYTIGFRVIMFALLPAWGLANAAATLVGQSLGAGKPERAEQAVWRAGLYNFVFLGVVGLLFALAAGPVARGFSPDPQVQRYAADCLRIVSLGFVFYAYGMVIGQAFNGAGDTWTPTVLNVLCFWLWELPLAYVLAAPMGLGARGAFVAVTVAFSTNAVAAVVVFRRGAWKRLKV